MHKSQIGPSEKRGSIRPVPLFSYATGLSNRLAYTCQILPISVATGTSRLSLYGALTTRISSYWGWGGGGGWRGWLGGGGSCRRQQGRALPSTTAPSKNPVAFHGQRRDSRRLPTADGRRKAWSFLWGKTRQPAAEQLKAEVRRSESRQVSFAAVDVSR